MLACFATSHTQQNNIAGTAKSLQMVNESIFSKIVTASEVQFPPEKSGFSQYSANPD
jgi:hypothetical protein